MGAAPSRMLRLYLASVKCGGGMQNIEKCENRVYSNEGSLARAYSGLIRICIQVARGRINSRYFVSMYNALRRAYFPQGLEAMEFARKGYSG